MDVSDDTRRWFGRLVEETRSRFAGLGQLGADPERLYGTAEAPEGGVTAVVAPGGLPVRLTLSTSALRLTPDELAERIVRTQREAAEDAARRQAEVAQELIGPAEQGLDVRAMVERAAASARLREAQERLDSAADDLRGGPR
ncbi:hypothetical protein ABZ570_09820 [Micromonospora sp. NPDC007271]|uniref:hypothetical protein n=1 Tax=Micromonospora sp. NPDC007271 TaxID=3154587 RepID=UPI0033FEAF35